MKITYSNQISHYGLLNRQKEHKHKNDSVHFHANPSVTRVMSSGKVLSLIGMGYVTIINGINKLVSLNNGEKNMNETEKYIELRDKFSKKLEPASINTELACWDFFINSNDKTQQKYQKAEDKLSELYKNEKLYNNLLAINQSELPEHEAKQLKDLLRNFEEELNTGEAKKALRKKEADIGQKYNTYVPKIGDKEVSKAKIAEIIQTETDVNIRKQAYEARIKGGDLIADDLVELVKMRNEYAKTKGYDNYFDYMLKKEYDVEPEFLDNLINEVYSEAQTKIKVLQEKRHNELKQAFNIDKLEPYHYGLLLDSNPEKGVNEVLKSYNANEHIIETLAKKTYAGMGYNIDLLVKEGKLTLDLYPRKNKNSHGFCFGIQAGKDSRILANLNNDVQSLDTLNHELGHCVYDLGLSTELPFLDRTPSSSAYTEAIAMMMGDIMKKEDVLKGIVSDELLQKFKDSHKDDEAAFVSRSLQIIDFERELYRNPDQNPAELWAKMKGKYLNRFEAPNNEWATIPHYLTHPGYYQNYFRATLMKAQIYNHLQKKLGNITENSNTAEYMNEHIFALGASVEEYELIKQLTGKEFSSEDFVKGL